MSSGFAAIQTSPSGILLGQSFLMEDLKHRSPLIRFGIFEVDVDARELSRQGLKVKLQEQPFQVLMRLLEHAGEVVTREDLQKELWPADTFVDFERGLNRAINKLREALGDDAESPRFIATLPRRGYRFLAPVEYPAGREVLGANASRIAIMPAYRERNVEASLPRAAVPARVVSALGRCGRTGCCRSDFLLEAIARICAAVGSAVLAVGTECRP